MGCEDQFIRIKGKKWGGKIPLVFSLIFWCLSTVMAGSDTGVDFLKIPTSARLVALGNAYTAGASGVDSLERNPAGLVKGMPALSFSHQQLFGENSLDYLGTAWPGRSPQSLSWGLSVSRLSYADQEARGLDRRSNGSISASDTSAGIALAKGFGPLQFGTQFKFIRQQVANYSAEGVAVDMGVLSRTPISRLTMGLAVRNLGPRMKFVNDEFNLPLMISGGLAYQVNQPLTFMFDVQSNPYQRQTTAALGVEFSALSNVTMRAGYLNKLAEAVNNSQESETNRGNFGGIGGLTAGLGFKLGQFSLDYAIAPFGELGNNHVFSISTQFGQSRKNVKEVDSAPVKDERSIIILQQDESNFGLPSGQ